MERYDESGLNLRTSDAEERPRNSARLSMLVNLIQQSNTFRGLPDLEASDALRQAQIWDAVGLAKIPTERLAESFQLALDNYDPTQPFGAAHIRNAWNAIRSKLAPSAPTFASGKHCRYCEDTGWQELRYASPVSGSENTYRRGCSCEKAPRAYRNSEPFKEPTWFKHPTGEWKLYAP